MYVCIYVYVFPSPSLILSIQLFTMISEEYSVLEMGLEILFYSLLCFVCISLSLSLYFFIVAPFPQGVTASFLQYVKNLEFCASGSEWLIIFPFLIVN